MNNSILSTISAAAAEHSGTNQNQTISAEREASEHVNRKAKTKRRNEIVGKLDAIKTPDGQPKYGMIGDKPIIWIDVKTVLNDESAKFQDKLLCDGLVMNAGDACVFSCTFCYVPDAMLKLHARLLAEFNKETDLELDLSQVVIRRREFLKVLRRQLVNDDGSRKYNDPADRRVLYSSTLVDVAATTKILEETAAGCILIFEHTEWNIRLLSKSHRLADLVLKKMIPEKYHHRLILGFSTGTLDDKLAATIEVGTSLVSKRIKALHKLQDLGIRTFGMICPSLPYGTQEDYDEFSRNMCEVLRIERCEHVWAEVINLRGDSLTATVAALRDGGFETEAQRLEAVSGPGPKNTWETYARMTFDAHAKHIPANKFRFLQYVTAKSASCWKGERQNGAVLLGSYAETNNLITIDTSAPSDPLPDLEEGDIRYREEREEIVTSATKINLCASEALWQIMTYKDGLLWRKDFQTFVKYCRSRWGCEKSHAYRHLKIGGFLARLENGDSPIGENRPQNESQVRLLLTKVPEEHQVDCWKSIVAKVPASELSARIVATETGKYLKKKGLDEKAVNTPKPDHRLKARLRAKRELNSLKAILGKLPFPARFEQLLYGIESLIEQEPQTEVGQAEITAVDPAPPHDPALATSDSAS